MGFQGLPTRAAKSALPIEIKQAQVTASSEAGRESPLNLSGCRGVLLTLGDYYGTLAATRYFGRMGIPVYLAEWRRMVPTALSRYVTEVVRCPEVKNFEAFGAWLMEYGKANPGLFLYPTNDDTAWIYSSHREKLKKHFYMLQPGRDTIYALLNKVQLQQACAKVGLESPKTWLVQSDAELKEIANRLSYPVLIKPRSQIGSLTHGKGAICSSPEELLTEYPKFMRKNNYVPEISDFDPFVNWPMIQSFHKDAMGHTLSVAGYISQDGNTFLVRSSRKVIQRPRKLGIGLCFEGCELPEKIATQCRLLCRELGYYGAFELEMIYLEESQTYLLIDFNPRYYSQMAFEITRKLALPGLVFSEATGQDEMRQKLIGLASHWSSEKRYIYSIKWLFYLFLSTALLGRNISLKEYLGWLKWLHEDKVQYVDAVMDKQDILPLIGDTSTQIFHYIRHPFSTWRRFFRDN